MPTSFSTSSSAKRKPAGPGPPRKPSSAAQGPLPRRSAESAKDCLVMDMQPVKFYQTGTFTVGNRLLAEHERSVQANMDRTNSLNSGHRACQGCGEALGARYAIDAAMRAARNQLIA